MSLRAFDSWESYADEIARAVFRKQTETPLRRLYAVTKHRADSATWLDAVDVLCELAQRNDRAEFNALAKNYGVLDVDITKLWDATRKAQQE